jgi:rhodanese-related sulfurtransferase
MLSRAGSAARLFRSVLRVASVAAPVVSLASRPVRGFSALVLPAKALAAPSLTGRSSLVPAAPVAAHPITVSERSLLDRAKGFYNFYTDQPPSITAAEFSKLKLESTDIVIDVREDNERAMFGYLEGARHVPMQELLADESIAERYAGLRAYVYCHAGKRSETVARCLRVCGIDAINISDGIIGFQELGTAADGSAAETPK